MGESFKLHAQALIGTDFEDTMMTEQSNGSTVPTLALHATEVAAY